MKNFRVLKRFFWSIFPPKTCKLDNPSSPIYWNRVSNPAFFWKSNTRIPHFEMLLQNKWMIKTSLLSYKECLLSLPFMWVISTYIIDLIKLMHFSWNIFYRFFVTLVFNIFKCQILIDICISKCCQNPTNITSISNVTWNILNFFFRTKSKKVINLKILPLLMNEFGFYIKGFRCFNCQGWSSYHDDLSDGFVYWRPLQELKPRSDQPSKLIPSTSSYSAYLSHKSPFLS